MPTGKVKWFNNAKGYGFILAEAGGEDLFVHYSSIQMDGYKTLKAGQVVHFDVQQGPKGSHAVNIQAEAAESAPGDAAATADNEAAAPGRSHPSDQPAAAETQRTATRSSRDPLFEHSN